MDTKPIKGSMNAVTSDGVFEALEEAGGGGANKDLSNVAFPLEWETGSGDVDYSVFSGGAYWEGKKSYAALGWDTEGEFAYIATTKDFKNWRMLSNIQNEPKKVMGANECVFSVENYNIVVSVDGENWSTAADAERLRLAPENCWAAYFKGSYYVAARNVTAKAAENSVTSEWSYISSAVGNGDDNITGMIANDDVIVVTTASDLYVSANGTTWTKITTNFTDLKAAATDGDILVVADSSVSGTHIIWSEDGTTWTESAIPDGVTVDKMMCDGSRFLAVSETDDSALFSQDGKVWEAVELPVSGVNGLLIGGQGAFYISNQSETVMHTTKTPDAYKRMMPIFNPLMANAGVGGGGGGDVVEIVFDDTTMSAEDLGVAVKAICDAGKIPVVVWSGGFYYSQTAIAEEGYFSALFCAWGFAIINGAVDELGIAVLILEYIEGDGWTLQDAYKEIVGGN